MPKKENDRDSRQRILDAALDVFYEAGFDGARVDMIAKRAGVNQALIYYYFKSKEELFTELIDIHVNEMLLAKKKALDGKDIYDMDIYTPDVVKGVLDKMMGVLKEKEKVFSIVLGEVFRNSRRKSDARIFEVFLPAIKESAEILLTLGMEQTDIDREIVAAIFFGSLPMMAYITLGEKLADHYGLDKENLRVIFTDMIYRFSEEYVAFLKDNIRKKHRPDRDLP